MMIYINGMGAVTGYGRGITKLWQGVLSGIPAAQLVPECGWIARVADIDGPGATRYARALDSAVDEAVVDSFIPLTDRIGFIHGAVTNDINDWADFYRKDNTYREPKDFLNLMPSTYISNIMQRYGFNGPAMNVSATCSTGNTALVMAKMWLDADIVDHVVVAVTDLSISPEMIDHFVRLGVAVADVPPLEACRPFQQDSRGFSVGEAAIAFVVSKQPILSYMVMLGGALSHDAHHISHMDLSLTHITSCIEQALRQSNVQAQDVRFFNSHGAGTKQCDIAERQILDNIITNAQVYSEKPLVGHCQGAAAAVEIAIMGMGYLAGTIPAAAIVTDAHVKLLDGPTDIDYDDITLKTSYGLGGHNSATVFKGTPSSY